MRHKAQKFPMKLCPLTSTKAGKLFTKIVTLFMNKSTKLVDYI